MYLIVRVALYAICWRRISISREPSCKGGLKAVTKRGERGGATGKRSRAGGVQFAFAARRDASDGKGGKSSQGKWSAHWAMRLSNLRKPHVVPRAQSTTHCFPHFLHFLCCFHGPRQSRNGQSVIDYLVSGSWKKMGGLTWPMSHWPRQWRRRFVRHLRMRYDIGKTIEHDGWLGNVVAIE